MLKTTDLHIEEAQEEDLNVESLENIARILPQNPIDPSIYYSPTILSRIVPQCYKTAQLKGYKLENYNDETLIYIFYHFPGDELQKQAFDRLVNRKWVFSKLFMCWAKINFSLVADDSIKNVVIFDPYKWEKINQDILFSRKFIDSLERQI